MISKRQSKFHGNVPTWLALAELKIDYYSHFVKAWIPFNAWFSSSYPNLKQDREIINSIKSETNPFRDKIIAYLQNENREANDFKILLGKLHYELDNNHIPSSENRICFSNVILEKNKLLSCSDQFKGFKTIVDYSPNSPKGSQKMRTQLIELNGLKTIMDWSQNDWNIDELRSLGTFQNIKKYPNEIQSRISNCYNNVNPYKPTNLVVSPIIKKDGTYKQPVNSIVINRELNLYFVDIYDQIAKGLIEIFYNLRNALFHGEINPTADVEKIYKEAYHILIILIQSLKN